MELLQYQYFDRANEPPISYFNNVLEFLEKIPSFHITY